MSRESPKNAPRDIGETVDVDTDGPTLSVPHDHQHHHSSSTTSPNPCIDDRSQKQEILTGPWRLLCLLPRESRNIIGLMLELDPRKRAKMEDMLNDTWVTDTPICRQEIGGKVSKRTSHDHLLVAS